MNAVRLPKYNADESRKGRDLLEEARNAFDSLLDFYSRRERAARFAFGNQWSDKMIDPDTGEATTEDAYIRSQGRMPAQNNQIGKTVRSLNGQFRSNYPDPVVKARARDKAEAGDMMTAALQAVMDINQCDDLDTRNFEEFMVSAQAGFKIEYDWWSEFDREDVLITNIDQSRFFFNMDSNDVRNKDVYLLGELLDMRWDELIRNFARSKADEKRLAEMFPNAYELEGQLSKLPQYQTKLRSFYQAESADLYRVICVWKKEYAWQYFAHDFKTGKYVIADDEFFLEYFAEEENDLYNQDEKIQLINSQRIDIAMQQGVDIDAVPLIELDKKYEEIWRVYYLSPLGDVLFMSDTPYAHQSHCYEFVRYPLFDGKTLSLVESIIDQQKHVNRLISMMDAAFGKSVNNIKMVPKQLLGDLSEQEFADQMVEYNGFMFYQHVPGIPAPEIIKENTKIPGANDLLGLQLELMKEISAVNDAVQGNTPQAGTSGVLYAQQSANALIGNKDLFDTYFNMLKRRNRKVVQLIKENYKETRYINISGTAFKNSINKTYQPDDVLGIDFDVVIGEAQQTLVYRQTVDNELKEFLAAQYIDIFDYLKTTSMPYADTLLTLLESKREQAQKQQTEGGAMGSAQPSEEELMAIINQHNNASAMG